MGICLYCVGRGDVAMGRTRLVCFSPARASGRITRTVIRKAKVGGVLPIGIALRAAKRTMVPTSTLTVVMIPMCKNHMTPLTVRHLRGVHNLSAPAILIIICNGHTCRGTLVRLSTFTLPRKLGIVTNTAFVNRRSCDASRRPVTTKHPGSSSLTLTARFKGGVVRGVGATANPSALCPVSIHTVGHPERPFFPLFHFLEGIVGLHGDNAPLPHAP